MREIDRILELAKKKNVSANKVAVECKLNASAMTDWKNGKARPGIDALVKIADYFNVSVDYILGRDKYTPDFYDIENDKKMPYEEKRKWLNDKIDKEVEMTVNALDQLHIERDKFSHEDYLKLQNYYFSKIRLIYTYVETEQELSINELSKIKKNQSHWLSFIKFANKLNEKEFAKINESLKKVGLDEYFKKLLAIGIPKLESEKEKAYLYYNAAKMAKKNVTIKRKNLEKITNNISDVLEDARLKGRAEEESIKNKNRRHH